MAVQHMVLCRRGWVLALGRERPITKRGRSSCSWVGSQCPFVSSAGACSPNPTIGLLRSYLLSVDMYSLKWPVRGWYKCPVLAEAGAARAVEDSEADAGTDRGQGYLCPCFSGGFLMSSYERQIVRCYRLVKAPTDSAPSTT
jgi:hypothetical protein